MVRSPPAMWKDSLGLIPGSERSPEEGMATQSSILAWRIPWTEEPGRVQSMGSQRIGHDWATERQQLGVRVICSKSSGKNFNLLKVVSLPGNIMALFLLHAICARFCYKNFIPVNSLNSQRLCSLSAAIFPVLLMRTLRPEHSNDLPKETHLAGGRSSNWTQAIWCYSQKSVPLHCVASMEDNFVFRPVRIDHWRMILIPAYASDTGAFALRRIWSKELFWFYLPSLISGCVHRKMVGKDQNYVWFS